MSQSDGCGGRRENATIARRRRKRARASSRHHLGRAELTSWLDRAVRRLCRWHPARRKSSVPVAVARRRAGDEHRQGRHAPRSNKNMARAGPEDRPRGDAQHRLVFGRRWNALSRPSKHRPEQASARPDTVQANPERRTWPTRRDATARRFLASLAWPASPSPLSLTFWSDRCPQRLCRWHPARRKKSSVPVAVARRRASDEHRHGRHAPQ